MSYERDELEAARERRDFLLSNYVEEDGPLETKCWIWQRGCVSQGYGHVKQNGITYKAHRLFWILKNGPIPEGMWCLHRCDRTSCCNPDHLFLGTPSDNSNDRDQKGRANVGNWGRSQFVGVRLHGLDWQAYARENGKQVYLGKFTTERQAAEARNTYDAYNGRPLSNDLSQPAPPPSSPPHFTGVSPHRDGRRWVALGRRNGPYVYLGLFGFAVDAAIAVNYHNAYHGKPIQNEILESPHD
jgi:hypothetical protein